jgi:cell wall-associated NlpC family hydrolase
MTIRDKIIEEARSWLYTPYHHQAAVKGIGVDCAYFIGAIAENVGLIDKFYVEPYSIEWHMHNPEEKMLQIIEGFGAVKVENYKPGDILVFKYGRSCSHLAILLPDNFIIHASIKHKMVLAEEFRDDYVTRYKCAYAYPGVV